MKTVLEVNGTKEVVKVKHKVKITPGKVISYVILIIWAITTIAPLVWVLNNSFKDTQSILSSSMSLPKSFDLKNYKTMFAYTDIPKSFLNSFIISGTTVIFVCLIGGLAAFILARFDFKGKNFVKFFIYTSMLVPQFAAVVPNLMLLRKIGINDSYFTMIIPQTACFLNFSIMLLSGFMSSIPSDLEEAAIIDGCSVPKIFFKITLPLSIPAFSTAAIITFLWSYNDLLLSLVYISSAAKYPICRVLALVSSAYGTNYGAMMAAVIITIIPVLILYAFSQKYLIKGLTAGAVKG